MNTLKLSFIGILMAVSTSYAGNVVFHTMYLTHDLVQGEGSSLNAAESDAKSAIPANCSPDSLNNSAVNECTKITKYDAESKRIRCDLNISGNFYRTTIPIVCK